MTAPQCCLALPPGVLAKLATKYPSAKWIISYQKVPWSKPELHPLAENSSCSTGKFYNHMAWVKLLPSVHGQAGCDTEARPPWRPRSLGSPVPSQHLAESPRSQNFSPAQIIQLCPILKTKGLLRSLGKTGMSHLSLSWWTMIWKFFQFRAAAATTTLFSRLKRVCWARTVEMFIHFLISRNLFHGCLAHPCQLCLAFRKPLHSLPSGTATTAVHSLHTPSANTGHGLGGAWLWG